MINAAMHLNPSNKQTNIITRAYAIMKNSLPITFDAASFLAMISRVVIAPVGALLGLGFLVSTGTLGADVIPCKISVQSKSIPSKKTQRKKFVKSKNKERKTTG